MCNNLLMDWLYEMNSQSFPRYYHSQGQIKDYFASLGGLGQKSLENL